MVGIVVVVVGVVVVVALLGDVATGERCPPPAQGKAQSRSSLGLEVASHGKK